MKSLFLVCLLLISIHLIQGRTVNEIFKGKHHLAPKTSLTQTQTPSQAQSNPQQQPVQKSQGVPTNIDCALKVFGAQFASYLQPTDWPHPTNWTAEVVSAFQLPTLCNVSVNDIPEPPFQRQVTYQHRLQKSQLQQNDKDDVNNPEANCQWTAYVDGTNGNNKNNGSINAPFQTIPYAVQQSRTRDPSTAYYACIYIRRGTYYLGSVRHPHWNSQHRSQVGAIALTAIDSGLTISNYPGDSVAVSGGVPLNLNWSTYKGDILQASVDSSQVDGSWPHFNELYWDGWRAIRAKYPNGDPFMYGKYSKVTGYFNGAASWIAPDKPLPAATEIHVSQPTPNSQYFPQFQIGIEGTASIFDPPHSYWALANPPGGGGSTFRRPKGLVANSELQGRMKNWSNPSSGFMFAFHCSGWGSNQYEIGSIESSNNTVWLGRGGFQEARGCDSGGDQYVHNLLEELDDSNEYFFDQNTNTLYYQPNKSESFPKQFVAAQAPCLISISGNPDQPARDITISGLYFTQTSNHFMGSYEAPSGGDYSVHRGGAIFITGSSYVTIQKSAFRQLGGNAIVVSDWNQNVSIIQNDFRFLGESAIILVGSADGIDGVSNLNQPNYTHIESNLVRDFSIYVKQGDAIFESVVRNSIWAGNVAFNAPRSIFNKNDGFAGGLDAYQNLLFNANRETSDHGPINTWDRQPYLTENNGQGPSLIPKTNLFHNNFLVNDYGSDMSIDHDDGSAFYLDSYNWMMYSGTKNYLGHTKWNDHQLFVYSDNHPGYGFPGCQDEFTSSYDEMWTNNKCILYGANVPYSIGYCDPTNSKGLPTLYGNTFYTPNNNVSFTCGKSTYNLAQWQSFSKQDGNSTAAATPDVTTVIGWGKQVLFLHNGYHVDEESHEFSL